MTDEPARFRCGRCAMNFRIQEPLGGAEKHRCPEQGCYLRFWSARSEASGPIKIGVYPEELAA